jgi:hypothetical protein
MASEVLMTISRDKIERARLMSEFKGEVDMQTHINDTKREIARNLKADGVPIGQITKWTGLPVAQVKGL